MAINQTISVLQKGVEHADTISSVLGTLGSVFSGISGALHSAFAFFITLGLSSGQAYAMITVIVLLALLGVFKFLMVLMKLLIVVLILWVVLSLIGLL